MMVHSLHEQQVRSQRDYSKEEDAVSDSDPEADKDEDEDDDTNDVDDGEEEAGGNDEGLEVEEERAGFGMVERSEEELPDNVEVQAGASLTVTSRIDGEEVGSILSELDWASTRRKCMVTVELTFMRE